MRKCRHNIYIDGLNTFYAFCNSHEPKSEKQGLNDKSGPFYDYKYVNWWKYFEEKIFSGKKDQIGGIYYFTAFPTWKQDELNQHQYCKLLRKNKVEVINGRFHKKEISCELCKGPFIIHEEKQTDVNLAVQLMLDGFDNAYDDALVVSSDSDLVPVIRALNKRFSSEDADFSLKKIGVMFPPGKERRCDALLNVSNYRLKMKIPHLKDCLFSENEMAQ